MLIIFPIQSQQLIPFFYYSLRFVLDNHHLSTDNIKFMSQQVIIARLERELGLSSLNDLCQWLQHNIQVFYSLKTDISCRACL